VHLLPIISLLATVFCLHLSSPHHVVFEEIDKMVEGLSCIHAIVPVNISGLVQAVHNFCRDVLALKKLYQDKKQPFGAYNKWFHQRVVNLLDLLLADANTMLSTLESL
jgi:hypothetical protein